jgi:RNA polymerase sigma-70 factor, ECF subfamily
MSGQPAARRVLNGAARAGLRPFDATGVYTEKVGHQDSMDSERPMTDEPQDQGRETPPDAAALWKAFAPPLRGFLARRVPPGVEADDLVQDVFLRVIRHAGSLRSTDRPEAWLFQIARNALRDSLRARLRRDARNDALETDDELPAALDAAHERAAEAELAPCLTAMVDRLAEPYRTAIALTTLDGVSQADAARRLGISQSGMKSRVQRGRDKLREMLVQCCAIALDVRGGVSDFHQHGSNGCGAAPAGSAGSCAGTSCGPGPTTVAASEPQDERLQH